MIWNRHITIEGDLSESIHNFINELKSFIGSYNLETERVLKELRIVLNFFKMPHIKRALGTEGISDFFIARIMDLVNLRIAYDKGDIIRKAKRVGYALECVLNYKNVNVDKVFIIVEAELKKI